MRWRNVTPAVTIRSKPRTHTAHCCRVGMFVGVGGPTAATVTLAEAVPPIPPSTDVTALVVLIFVPNVVPVTVALKVHEALPARLAPVKLMLPDPPAPVISPPPQLPLTPSAVP